jgi:hypothetical protein
MATEKFLLLGTAGCHLCEEAELIVSNFQLELELIDIAEQEQWQPEYALRIPVLLHADTEQMLGWPFTAEDVGVFIKKCL